MDQQQAEQIKAAAMSAYIAVSHALELAEHAQKRMADLPLEEGECPCGCARSSAEMTSYQVRSTKSLIRHLMAELDKAIDV